MKKISLSIVILLFVTSTIIAQKTKDPVVLPKMPIDSATNLITYEKVIEIAGKDKMVLFKRALSWANTYYKNPGDVIREKDSVDGKMVCKARYKMYNEADKKGVVTDAGDVMYTLSIMFKDNRFKYEITKFNWQQLSSFPAERWLDIKDPSFTPAYAYYLKQTDDKVKEISLSLEKRMREEDIVKKDDW